MPGLINHVAERNRAAIINALESIFGHTTHDLFRQISRVIFGITLQHRFQNDTLRASRNDFRCRHQLHTVLLQLGFVPGTVVTVSGETVEFPDNNGIEQTTFTVLNHLLELRTVIGLSRDCSVNIVLDHGEIVLLCIGGALTNLAFDGFFALVIR